MPLDLTPWTASIILGSLIVSTYARNFQMHAFPAPSPGLPSIAQQVSRLRSCP